MIHPTNRRRTMAAIADSVLPISALPWTSPSQGHFHEVLAPAELEGSPCDAKVMRSGSQVGFQEGRTADETHQELLRSIKELPSQAMVLISSLATTR